MKNLSRLLLLACVVALSVNARAQGRSRGPLPLAPGDPMPVVQGYDEEGNPFALSDLKGHHTVIAFGCLT